MEQLSKKQVLELAEEYVLERKKTQIIPRYFRGMERMTRVGWPCYTYTKRYHELSVALKADNAKIFSCSCCGKHIGYLDLNLSASNFQTDEYVCFCCSK